MASSRLRKTFEYPDSDDSDEDVDEEHQELLIAQLQADDARKSELYRNLFLSIPFSAVIFYFITLLSARNARQRLISLLAISSLASTAYILYYQPLEKEDKKGKRALYAVEAGKGPVERYLGALNAALAGVLLLAAVVSWRAGRGEEALREALPAVVMGLAAAVRVMLRPIDLEELEGAKFDLKGA